MNPLELIPYLKAHRSFAIGASLGLAILFVEEGWATFYFWSGRPASEAIILIGLVGAVVFIGYLFSFLFPPSRVNASWHYPRAWGVFGRVTGLSIAIALVTNIIAFGLLLYLAEGDLIAAYNLLRDVYVYTFVGLVIFHGLLLYVRYLRYIYQTFGAPPPGKVIGASVGVGVLILLIVGFIFSIDLGQLELASAANQGISGLHTYGRALYLFTLMLAAYVWHLRWVGDH